MWTRLIRVYIGDLWPANKLVHSYVFFVNIVIFSPPFVKDL